MPAADADLENDPKLPFPPITQSHILHCSTHYWYPKYRSLTPKSRLIPLSPAFVTYLNADGIVLPPEGEPNAQDDEFEADLSAIAHQNGSSAHDSDDEEGDETDDAEEVEEDPSARWPEVHSAISSTIAELGGKVVPKLNWSAPKDATWINPTNSMECRTPNDIYLMLKSSDFVTHDLEHAFDGCVDEFEETTLNISDDDEELPAHSTANDHAVPSRILLPAKAEIPYTLMLRKSFALNPSVEFRCFVRHRRLLAISQRSVNYFDFLFPLVSELRSLITDFFDDHVKATFPDENFVFDVYVPDPYRRVWLIDFNPWAPRTDPLLFSWLELLTMEGPEDAAPGFIESSGVEEISGDGGDDEEAEEVFQPEFRLIKRDDPEAYSFNTPQYSAHKLPSDVVQASNSGPGPLREFAEQWKEALNRGEQR